MTDDCREAFEKWIFKYGPNLIVENGVYVDSCVQSAWNGWQAALSAPKPAGDAQGALEAINRLFGAVMYQDLEEFESYAKDAETIRAALSSPKIDFDGLKREVGPKNKWVGKPENDCFDVGWNDCLDHIAAKYPQLRGE